MPNSSEQEAVRFAAKALHKHMLAHAPPGAQPDPEAVRDMVQVVVDSMRDFERVRQRVMVLTQHEAPLINAAALQEAYERGRRDGRGDR